MKNLYALLLSLGLASAAHAQITISQADMPVSGDTLRYSVASPVGIPVPTQVGANQTWDYSTLTPTRQALTRYQSVASINPLFVLTFGLQAYGTKVADSIGIGPIAVENVYNYFRRNSSSFSVVGRSVEFQGLPLPANYSDPDELYTFPLQFGDVDSTTFRTAFNVAGQGSLVQRGTRTNRVVGWGSITTPNGTFQALMVRVTERRVDSIISSQLPVPIGFPSVTRTIVWLAAGQKIPVLELAIGTTPQGRETVTGVQYRDRYRNLAPSAPLPAFATPRRNLTVGDSTFFVNLTPPSAGGPISYQWSVEPLSGWRFAAGTSAGSTNPVIAFTAPGSYSIGLRATSGGLSADTLERDYIRVSDPTALQRGLAAGTLRLQPNPAQGHTLLALPAAEAARPWFLTAADGRQTRTYPTVQGTYLRFATQGLAPGLYLLSTPPANGDAGLQLRLTVAE